MLQVHNATVNVNLSYLNYKGLNLISYEIA